MQSKKVRDLRNGRIGTYCGRSSENAGWFVVRFQDIGFGEVLAPEWFEFISEKGATMDKLTPAERDEVEKLRGYSENIKGLFGILDRLAPKPVESVDWVTACKDMIERPEARYSLDPVTPSRQTYYVRGTVLRATGPGAAFTVGLSPVEVVKLKWYKVA